MANIINSKTTGTGGIEITSVDTTGDLNIQSGGTTVATVVASGNVGIGTTSPRSLLDIKSTTADALINLDGGSSASSYLNFRIAGTNKGYIGLGAYTGGSNDNLAYWTSGAGSQLFYTNSTLRMSLDSSGNLGLGVTPGAWSDGYKAVSCVNAGNAFAGVASQTVITQGSRYDSGWKYTLSSIASDRLLLDSGTFSYANAPAGTSGNAATFTTRFSVNPSGVITFCSTPVATSAPGATIQVAGNQCYMIMSHGSQTSLAEYFYFYNGTGLAGRIYSNGATTTYATSSDYRLKEDVKPMVGALAKVALLKPVTYKWKCDGTDGQGFIAHELQEVVPDCVGGEKDAVNEDGSIKPQGIDTSFLVATLTAAIQEQQALIENLTSRIAALEAK